MLLKGWVNKVRIHMGENTQTLRHMTTWWISEMLQWGKEATLERLQAVWGHVYDLWKKSKLQGLRIEGWLPEAWVKSLTTKREHSGIFGILGHSDCDWQSHEPTTIYTYSKKKKKNQINIFLDYDKSYKGVYICQNSPNTLNCSFILCKRRRGWQRMRRLDSIPNSMATNLSRLQGAWRAAVPGAAERRTQLRDWTATK